jgi:hypothetical protein
MAKDADNIVPLSMLKHDNTTHVWTAEVHHFDGKQTHIEISDALFMSARAAAQVSPASWVSFLTANPSEFPPSVVAWHTAPRQDIIRQIVGFCPLPPPD